MDWLNYHHLLYFWTVARTGSIVKASEQLRLTQPTISEQIRLLENSLGEKLFQKVGRNLVLTETGKTVYGYAEEIFALGKELTDSVHGRPTARPMRLLVGITDSVPKLIAYRLLEPALKTGSKIRIICHEGAPDALLARLAVHELDVVITDFPLPPTVNVKAFSHLLGECGVTFFGPTAQAAKYRSRFPKSLDGAPMLLPNESSSTRRSLDQWFDANGIRPQVIGEFEDSALMNVFGQAGAGLFAGPSAIEKEIVQQFRVKPIGRTDAITECFYAISTERRLKNPAIVAISNTARARLFHHPNK